MHLNLLIRQSEQKVAAMRLKSLLSLKDQAKKCKGLIRFMRLGGKFGGGILENRKMNS